MDIFSKKMAVVTIHRSGHCWQWNWQPWQPAAPTAVKLFFSAARYAHSCTHPPALLFLFSCETAGLVTVYKHAVTVSIWSKDKDLIVGHHVLGVFG